MPNTDVTAAELAILEQLWHLGRSTIKELAQILYGGTTPSDIATVQKLLGRLEAKSCVGRNREKWPKEFFPTIQRENWSASVCKQRRTNCATARWERS